MGEAVERKKDYKYSIFVARKILEKNVIELPEPLVTRIVASDGVNALVRLYCEFQKTAEAAECLIKYIPDAKVFVDYATIALTVGHLEQDLLRLSYSSTDTKDRLSGLLEKILTAHCDALPAAG